MSKWGRIFIGWSVFVVALGSVVGWFTWTVLLKEARTPYEVTVARGHEFEQAVLEKHPGVEFVLLPKNIQLGYISLNGRYSRSTALERISFIDTLRGSETIFIVLSGATREYILPTGWGELPVTYIEAIPAPEGTAYNTSWSLDEVVFEKDTFGDLFLVMFLGVFVGSVLLWVIGAVRMMYTKRSK